MTLDVFLNSNQMIKVSVLQLSRLILQRVAIPMGVVGTTCYTRAMDQPRVQV